jgi:membrane protein implicated in regulation of membrane protease activity/DNA-binding XRE family transcriptional regulator
MALFLLNVGIAAFVAAVLAYFQVAVALQLVVFVALSLVLILLARPRMLRVLLGHVPTSAISTQPALTGRIATVTEAVTVEGGEIRIGKGEFWSARTFGGEIAAGSQVRITAIEGLTACVEPLDVPLATSPMSAPDDAHPTAAVTPTSPSEHDALAAASAEPPSCGALLKRYRVAAGLTQEELAERAGLSVRAISDLERGLHRSPQRETVQLLAAALDLAPADRATFEAAARRLREPSSSHGS